MKKNKILSLFLWWAILATISTSWAVMAPTATYSTSAAFLAAEWWICKVATDGCNTITIQDGQLWASTMMACLQSDGITMKPQVWSCQEYNDNIQFFWGNGLPWWDVDEHGCKPSTGYSWDSVAEKCLRPWEENTSGFSQSDINQYDTIKANFSDALKTKIDASLSTYKERLSQISLETRKEVNSKTLSRVEKFLSDFIFQFPQDKALSWNNLKIYNLVTYLKYKLLILQNNF